MLDLKTPSFSAFTNTNVGISHHIITELSIIECIPNKTTGLRKIDTKGLWDTGASKSAISPKVAKALNLKPIGMIDIQHANGVTPQYEYIVHFRLPNQVDITEVRVSEAKLPDQFGALIGMDIITVGDFSITNVNSKTLFSFRIPSVKSIDYAKEALDLKNAADKAKYAGVSRNAPCPCGSGVKFKKCHGK